MLRGADERVAGTRDATATCSAATSCAGSNCRGGYPPGVGILHGRRRGGLRARRRPRWHPAPIEGADLRAYLADEALPQLSCGEQVARVVEPASVPAQVPPSLPWRSAEGKPPPCSRSTTQRWAPAASRARFELDEGPDLDVLRGDLRALAALAGDTLPGWVSSTARFMVVYPAVERGVDLVSALTDRWAPGSAPTSSTTCPPGPAASSRSPPPSSRPGCPRRHGHRLRAGPWWWTPPSSRPTTPRYSPPAASRVASSWWPRPPLPERGLSGGAGRGAPLGRGTPWPPDDDGALVVHGECIKSRRLGRAQRARQQDAGRGHHHVAAEDQAARVLRSARNHEREMEPIVTAALRRSLADGRASSSIAACTPAPATSPTTARVDQTNTQQF